MSPTKAAGLIPAVGGGGGGGPPLTDLLGWWKADAEAYADTDPVPLWTDQAGSYDLAAGGDEIPTFRTGQVNGLPAIEFDGSTDTLQGTSTGGMDLSGDLVIAVVLKMTSTAHNHSILCCGPFFSGGEFNYWASSSLNLTLERPWVEAGVASSSGMTLNTWHYVSVHVSGTAVAHFLDGVANGTDTLATGTVVNDTMRMRLNSGSPFFQGLIAEMLLYDAALSGGDLVALHGYLAGKFGI